MRGLLACIGRKNNAYSDLLENQREADDLEEQMYGIILGYILKY